jgi:hypothetical protein
MPKPFDADANEQVFAVPVGDPLSRQQKTASYYR